LNIILHKFREIIFSILPIALLVLILHFTIAPLVDNLIWQFLIGSILIILGLTIFLLGVDIGVTPIGNIMGSRLAKKNNLMLILIGGLGLGFFISIAEPDLHIIAKQVDNFSAGEIAQWSLIIMASIGIAITFAYGLLRIVKNISLQVSFLIFYLIALLFAIFSPPELLAVVFDTAGATTGALTVPFVLAIAIGIARLQKDSFAASKDSFGLVGLVSVGAIIFGLILTIFNRSFDLKQDVSNGEHYYSFLETIRPVFLEVSLALLPIVLIFFVLNFFVFKFKKHEFLKTCKGLFYTFLGMSLFLIGVNGGFLEVGNMIGQSLANIDLTILIIICFFLGMTTILAEPAVYVLTKQIENVTSGYIKRSLVLFFLAIGVGGAIVLAMLRIQFNLELWPILFIGYGIALLLTFFSPKLFIGIAFDSGAVASGPMTATFILAFMHGIASASADANILVEGFGMISLVALTPIITLQILGVIYNYKSVKGGIS